MTLPARGMHLSDEPILLYIVSFLRNYQFIQALDYQCYLTFQSAKPTLYGKVRIRRMNLSLLDLNKIFKIFMYN